MARERVTRHMICHSAIANAAQITSAAEASRAVTSATGS